MRANVTNVALATALGVQHTTVSRWRSGDRIPNRDAMLRIFDRFTFLTEDQMKAAADGTYAEKFEAALAKVVGWEEASDTPTQETSS